MSPRNPQNKGEFFVGQKGDFLLLDSFGQPIETVAGEIVRLMDGRASGQIYAMIKTAEGLRPARLN
ncbi:MAG: hypothetical protein P8Y91_08745 [Desulfuromonadales bacterium]|jgi:hypothetical protein